MEDYFERIWEQLPPDAEPENFELRRRFLLSHVRPGERVLDLGCGTGEFTAALAAAGAAPVGVDVAAEALRRARERHPGLRFEPAVERVTDGSFDAVWLGETLEHVQDCATLLSEAWRALRPGGRLLVSTPDHPRRLRLMLALSDRRFGDAFDPRADHVRFFVPRSLRVVLADANFTRAEIARRRGTLLACAQKP